MTPSLLTRKQVARRLNVTPRTIENYCQRGIIPFVVLPGGRRFDPIDIEQFIIGRKFFHHNHNKECRHE